MKKDGALLEVENLHTYFPVMGGAIWRKVANLKAVDGISFRINRGEILGLVGESGCGKTTTGRCIMKLCKITRGKVFYEGKDLSKLSGGKMRSMRRNIQMIFENPHTSLDPMMSVEEILAEPLQFHNLVKRGMNTRSKLRSYSGWCSLSLIWQCATPRSSALANGSVSR